MSKTTNEFGYFMKALRAKHHENIVICAQRLGVSIAFVSSLENGKKLIPAKYAQKIIDTYDLKGDLLSEFLRDVDLGNRRVTIHFEGLSEERANVAIDFKRAIATMSDADLERIKNVLNK